MAFHNHAWPAEMASFYTGAEDTEDMTSLVSGQPHCHSEVLFMGGGPYMY